MRAVEFLVPSGATWTVREVTWADIEVLGSDDAKLLKVLLKKVNGEVVGDDSPPLRSDDMQAAIAIITDAWFPTAEDVAATTASVIEGGDGLGYVLPSRTFIHLRWPTMQDLQRVQSAQSGAAQAGALLRRCITQVGEKQVTAKDVAVSWPLDVRDSIVARTMVSHMTRPSADQLVAAKGSLRVVEI